MGKELFVCFFVYVKEVKDFIVFVIFFCKVIEVCKVVVMFGFENNIKEFIVVFIECFYGGVMDFEGLLIGEIFCIILNKMY